MSDLKARVKALEDLMQAIQRCFLAPPAPQQPKPAEQPAPTVKQGIFKDCTLKNTLSDINGDIRPQHYIADKELWRQINEDLEAHGFKWQSAGKESRWIKQ